MSYYMSQMENDFFIAKDKIPFAWNDVSNLFRGTILRGISYPDIKDEKSFAKIMKKCGWEIEFDNNENCDCIYFCGEKYSDDEVLFEAIAPYVRDGSYIQMQGEEVGMWRWVFLDGEVIEKRPTIIW